MVNFMGFYMGFTIDFLLGIYHRSPGWIEIQWIDEQDWLVESWSIFGSSQKNGSFAGCWCSIYSKKPYRITVKFPVQGWGCNPRTSCQATKVAEHCSCDAGKPPLWKTFSTRGWHSRKNIWNNQPRMWKYLKSLCVFFLWSHFLKYGKWGFYPK